MSAELKRAVTVIREALDDLAHLSPDEIAEKLRVEGMLWCDPGRRSTSCPIHHWITARLKAHGYDRSDYYLTVGTEMVRNLKTAHGEGIPHPLSVRDFIDQYDEGRYKHLEVPA